MELKNAVSICLLSLFSATLVVLIARALDNQAAARLEPQLAKIVEELEVIRKSGGLAMAPAASAESGALQDGLMVYYFHGNVRCATCQAIESQTHQVVEDDFAEAFQSKEIGWEVLNYDEPESSGLVERFGIHMANVVLAQMEGGEIKDWKRLDQVWALVGDKPAFAEFIRTQINQMRAESVPPADLSEQRSSAAPDVPELPAPPLPQNRAPAGLPLPE
ncbi:MAG: nitrophenyl compound nitroreductase subunit ArsF family protein [bacterium]